MVGISKIYPRYSFNLKIQFFSHFGEVDLLEIHDNVAIILFKSYFEAYTAREFLLNRNNWKESEKNYFAARWYTIDDEKIISESLRNKMKSFTFSQIVENSNFSNIYSTNSNNNYYNSFENLDSMSTDLKQRYNYYSAWTLTPGARQEFQNILVNNNKFNVGSPLNTSNLSYNQQNSNLFTLDKDDSNSNSIGINGKYTCRFDIQIENDNKFQVARRLIGSKV